MCLVVFSRERVMGDGAGSALAAIQGTSPSRNISALGTSSLQIELFVSFFLNLRLRAMKLPFDEEQDGC